MKKSLKRIIAIVAAVAMTVTGITFTPAVKTVNAETSWISVTGVPSGAWGGKKSQYTLGTTSDTSGDGKWDLEVSQNQWGNWEGRYKNADSIDGFTFNNQVYNNAGGVFLWSHDLKSEYGLTAGTDYQMTVTVSYGSIGNSGTASQHNYVLTEGGTNNMNFSRTVSANSTETYTATVKPGSADFILRLSWTTANYQTAEKATFTVDSVTFTPTQTTTDLTTWQRVPVNTADFVPETGSPWALTSNNDSSSSWGNQEYKMDTSKKVSDVSRMHLRKRYTDGTNKNDWWWDSAALLGYGTTLGLDNGTAYTGQIVVNTDTATSGSHKFRIVAFNKEYNVSLSAGDNTINIPKFKYNKQENDDIKFVYVEMPEDAEFYIKSISFASIYADWTKAAVGPDQAISNSNWSTSVNNDGSSSYGDIRYKHNTSKNTNDPARIDFKMAGAIGEAERTPQGQRITDPAQRWWWMSADLTGDYRATVHKSDSTTATGTISEILEEDERYTAVITVNSSDATLTDQYGNDTKLFITPFGGTEQAFDLAVGDNDLSLQEFVYDGSNANIKFLFDELVQDSELTVESIVFTQVNDGWHKAKPNQDVTPSGSPWTLYADYRPDTDLSDGDQGLYGDMWYKVDGSGVSGTSIKPKSVAVGEAFYWNKATLKDYLSTTAGLQDGHSYTGTITVNYTAGEAESGKTPMLRYIVTQAATGEANKVLNSGSGNYTINLDEFIYNPSDNNDIQFDLTGLEKNSIFKVTNITFTEQDSDWTNVKGETATVAPWILTANNDGSEQWGHLRYKQTGSGVSSVQVKPIVTSMGDHFYWNTAKLTNMAYGQTLTTGAEYTATISVSYTAGTAEAGKTPELLYNIPAAGVSEETMLLNNGSGNYTISVPAFSYDSTANNYVEFELDSLEKTSIFKVNSITFTPTGWKQVPKNTAYTPTDTPWTLTATNDQSTPGEEQWGDMSYKVDGTASAISSTLIKPNATAVGEHFYWNKAELKNYMATLSDGHSYTGSITVNYTPGEAVQGKTPELRTVISAAKTGELDTVLTSGTNTISIDEFIYESSAENKDVLFELDGLEKGSVFQVTGITFTEVDADWTNVKGGTASPTPWILTANNDGSEQWGHLRYKQTGSGVSSVQVKPMSTSMGDHFYWNSAKLTNMAYGQTLTAGNEYTAVITVQYTAGTAEAGKTPELLYNIPAAGVSEETKALNSGSGTYTINVPAFTYDSSADNYVEFELDSLEKKSVFKVTDITFTSTGWKQAPKNTDFTPTGTPWTLHASNDQSTPGEEQWGDMSYKVTGTASNVSATEIRPNATAVGEHFYWNTATLENYLATLSDGHSYTGSITVNYTPGEAEAGKTPELRTIVTAAGTGELDQAVTSGSNTISIDEFIYSSAAENKDIKFELDGLEKGSVFQVTGITFTEVDSDWTNVKGGTASPTPWILTANNDGSEQWGHLRYKQTGSGVSSVQVKPMSTSMGDHFYWNTAKLTNMAYGQTLTAGNEYTAVITVQYTAGTAEAGKTPELLYNIPAAGVSEETKALNSGSGTYTINVPAFTYDSSADNYVEFELDSLEKKSVFKVTDITFTATGWKQAPKNTDFTPTGTPWTLHAANDQSTPGEEQWGDMSYKVDGTASNISSTLIRPNATDVGEHYYWNTATLKNYMATLSDGHSYTGSITVNYTPGEAVSGKTPELRTVISAAKTGELDTALTSGTNTISIDEFIYESSAENKDVLFELDGLEKGSVFQVTGITFTEVDADWTNVKGGTATVAPWILTANNDGSQQWGHLRYKQTGSGVSSVQVKPMSTSMGDHFYWNTAKLTDMTYGQTLTPGKEYTAVITVQYTAGTAEAGKTPELLYNIPVAGVSEATKVLNSGSGTYTINVPAFAYDSSANNYVEFELDSLEKKSIFKVTNIAFTDTGWTKVTQNSDLDNPTTVNPSGTPWTLRADWIPDEDLSDGDQGMYGDMSYKVTGTASNVSATQLKINKSAVGEHFYWETATLKNYLNTLEDGCSYTGSITVNYTPGTAEAGKTPQLRTAIEGANTGNIDTNLSSGTNTISIDEFIYSSSDTRKDILFELTGLEAGSIFQVTAINFTKQDADWTNVKGGSATVTPWILTANNDGSEQWGHLRYKQTGSGVSSVQVKPMATSMGDHFYWNSAKLSSIAYGQTLTAGEEYTATITINYTAGEAESGKTPELLYNIPVAGISEETMTLSAGTNTINVPAFTYDASADNSLELELDSLEKKSIIQVTDITFTSTGWKQAPKNTDFTPTGTPWTLHATNDQSTPGEEQWGDMSYKVDGTASTVSSTLIRPNATAVGEHFYWNTATLENYLATLEDGCSYTGSITVNYTPGEAEAGKTPELRTIVTAAGTGELDQVVTSGTNTITIDKFVYSSSAENKDIKFELDGLEKGSVFQVTGITFTKQDADWTNVKGGTATVTPWTLTANNDGDQQWGHLRYKQTGSGVSSVQVKPINTSMGDHFYWNSAKLSSIAYGQTLTAGEEYTAVITVQYTAGTAEAGKTPELLYNIPAAGVSEETKALNNGSGTYTINVPAFTYDSSADNSLELELDSLEKESIIQVTDITFTSTGWKQAPKNTDFTPTGTPWTLHATNDQSTPGEEQWGDMSYKVDGTASTVSSTLIRPNATAVGEHFYWNTATLENYLATLEDGCSYTGSITVNYTPGEAEAGKTPELRTIVTAAGTGELDQAVTSGTNTISISEFIYSSSAENKDIKFELDGLEKGSVFQVTGITFTKQDADWTNVKGETANPDPWTLTANYDGSTQWGHMRYKQTGTGVSSVQIKPVNTSMGDHFYWNSAKLAGYLGNASLTDKTEYTATITVDYTPGTAETGKTPEVLYNIPMAGISEETQTLSSGTNTINVPAFTYDASASAADKSIEFELDSLEKMSIFHVTDITFTPTGWKKIPYNTATTPTGTPWTLTAANDQSTPGEEQWGDISYKVDGTASEVSSTLIKPNATAVGEHYYWNKAELKNYLASLEDGCSYTGSITVNYTPGKAVAGKTPELRTVIAAAKTGELDQAVSSGSNTISIDEFVYNSADANKDILFELDGLEEGSVFQVTGITFTKQDADWTNVKGETANPDPWTLTANYDGSTQWGHMRYKKDGSGVSSVQIKPVNTSMGDHFYWNSAKLAGYITSAGLTAGTEYDATITVNYTPGEAESGKTPEVLYNVPMAGVSENTKTLNSGTNTITLPAFTYDASANGDIEFELDSLEKMSIFQVTGITFTPTGYKNVPANVSGGFVPEGTPWALTVTNDASQSWGAMQYNVDGTPSNIASTTMKLVNNSGTSDYSWTSASLPNYGTSIGAESDFTYGGTIEINPEAEGILTVYVLGQEIRQDLSKSHTIVVPNFIMAENAPNDVTFMFDEMVNGTTFSVPSINIERIDTQEGFEKVPGNVDFTPTGTPWTLHAAWDQSTPGEETWGKMWYSVEGDPSDIGSTKVRMINGVENLWWDSMKLEDYIGSTQELTLEEGASYTASIKYEYDPNPDRNGKPGAGEDVVLVTVANAPGKLATVEEGTGTIVIDEFTYDGSNNDIEFLLDGLTKRSEFAVTEIKFAKSSWARVPDEDTDFSIPVDYSYKFRDPEGNLSSTHEGTHNWTVFAGEWGGHGAILYYDEDLDAAGQPRIKIGAGERWDPACAQFKLANTDAYQDLDYYTSYYMTYKFYSTQAGTVHITQEGYDPNRAERIDVVEGWNTYKKYVTRLPGQDYLNLYMSLTYTTYEYDSENKIVQENGKNKIIVDGTPLPENTVLSDFSVEFQKTDSDVFTLVNDCRYEGYQDYTPIINSDIYGKTILEGYCNSFYKGWLSYHKDSYPAGENDIAKAQFRLDSTNGDYGSDDPYNPGLASNTWPCHLRIPNSYFYGNREATTKAEYLAQPVGTDTNGDPLVDGKQYLLRFYYDVEIPSGSTIGNNKGIVMTREGYDSNQHFRYNTVNGHGLNMANGTLTNKSGYNTHDEDYGKTGGIPITYNDSKRTTNEQYNTNVQFDFSDLPSGTIIKDISWEFYTPKVYTCKVVNADDPDEVLGEVQKLEGGETYTVPTLNGIDSYTYEGQPINPGTQLTVEDDITIYAHINANAHTVKLMDGDEVVKTDTVVDGGSYTFPAKNGKYDNVKRFDGVSPTTGSYQPEAQITNITEDRVYEIVREFTVTIRDAETGQELGTTTVEEGSPYTFPAATGVYEGVQTFKGVEATGTTGTYQPQGVISSVNKDLVFDAQKAYTITIDGTVVATVPAGDSYTFPTSATQGYEGVQYFVDGPIGGQNTHMTTTGKTITPTSNISVNSVYTVKIVDNTGKLMLSQDVVKGDDFTFPAATGKFDDVADFKGIEGSSETKLPESTIEVNNNMTFQMEMADVYTVTIDGKVVDTVVVGDTYTFPTATGDYAGAKYFLDSDGTTKYNPQATITPAGNIVAKSVYAIEIYDTDGTTLLKTDDKAKGDTYTFPAATGTFVGVKDYVGIDGTTGTYNPEDTMSVAGNAKYKIEKLAQYTITIDGTVVDTVYAGETYQFPAATGTYDGVDHFATVNDPTSTYLPEQTITPEGNVNVESVYTITIVGTDGTTVIDTFDVPKGDGFTFPTATGDYLHVQDFRGIVGTTETYEPEDQIGVSKSMTFQIEMLPQYTVTIDGTDVATVYKGDTYTFPTSAQYNNTIYFVDDNDNEYHTGTGYTVNDNISVTSVYEIKIYDTDEQTEMKTDAKKLGETYTFPAATGDFEGVGSYTGIKGTSGTYTPTNTMSVEGNANYKVNRLSQYTITIDGTVVDTVYAGETYQFPAATGDYAGVQYFKDVNGDTTYDPADTITPEGNISVSSMFTVKIVDTDGTTEMKSTDVPRNGTYKFPSTEEQGFENAMDFVGIEGSTATYEPEDEMTVDTNMTFKLEENPTVTYTWTVDGENPQTVPAGTTITLPNTAQIGYLLEYTDGTGKDVTDDIYSPGANYEVNRNVNFISINSVSMETTDAASMYYKNGTDMRGIRFLTKLTVNDGKNDAVTSSNAFEAGMLMTPYDVYTDVFDEELNLETVAANPELAYNVTNTTDKTKKWVTGMPAGYFSCGITYIKDSNITRDFVAKGYVKVNYKDDHDPYVTYGTVTSPYSIKYVAQKVYEDTETYNNLPGWKKAIVDECREYPEG